MSDIKINITWSSFSKQTNKEQIIKIIQLHLPYDSFRIPIEWKVDSSSLFHCIEVRFESDICNLYNGWGCDIISWLKPEHVIGGNIIEKDFLGKHEILIIWNNIVFDEKGKCISAILSELILL